MPIVDRVRVYLTGSNGELIVAKKVTFAHGWCCCFCRRLHETDSAARHMSERSNARFGFRAEAPVRFHLTAVTARVGKAF